MLLPSIFRNAEKRKRAPLIIPARRLIEIILHAGGIYATLGDPDTVINDHRKILQVLSERENIFFSTLRFPPPSPSVSPTSPLPPLVLIVFSITNDSNETDIPKQEPPEGTGREIGFRLRGRINARGRLIRQY